MAVPAVAEATVKLSGNSDLSVLTLEGEGVPAANSLQLSYETGGDFPIYRLNASTGVVTGAPCEGTSTAAFCDDLSYAFIGGQLGEAKDTLTITTPLPTFTSFGLGRGNDVFHGNDQRDIVRGNLGRDKLVGGGGPDSLRDEGDDFGEGAGGSNTLKGQDGRDFISMEGGDGGHNRLYGGAGRDVIDARNAVAERTIDCGPQKDIVYLDAADPQTQGCEVRRFQGHPPPG